MARVVRCRAFLDHLGRHGFEVGVDRYLAAERLLERVGDRCRPQELKTLLCPVIARDRDEQERFYVAFDAFYPLFAPPPPQSPEDSTPPEDPPSLAPPRRRWRARLQAGALALALAIGAFFIFRSQGEPVGFEDAVSDTTVAPPTDTTLDTMTITATAPDAVAETAPDPLLTRPQPVEPEPEPDRHWRWLAAALFAPALLALAYEALRRSRRVGRRAPSDVPPFVWPVRAPEASVGLFLADEGFQAAARALRRRERGNALQLWVEGSVAATAETLYPTLRYRHTTRVPEYLLLIDRHSLRDHQAQLFAALAAALRSQDAYVDAFHFEGDARLLYPPSGPPLPLAEVRRRHADHRLLVFGSGASFRDPVSGRLLPWVKELAAWRERAVLTPAPPTAWGAREQALKDEFLVFPATLEGLGATLDYFEGLPVRDGEGGDGTPPVPLLEDVDLEELRAHLGDGVFRWLCACAAYPELHWELTLTLGKLEAVGHGLVNEDNLLRLARLPWFRAGAIPDPIRLKLLEWLERLDPAAERAVREAVRDTLRCNGPAAGSAAADRRELEALVQELFIERRSQRRRKVLDRLRAWPSGLVLQDAAAAALLAKSSRFPFASALPRKVRERLFVDGVPGLGTTGSGRAILAVGAMTVGLCAAFPVTRNFSEASPEPGAVAGVAVTLTFAALEPGDSIRIVARPISRDDEAIAGVPVTWLTSGEVEVSDSGVALARRPGSGWVRASASGVSTEFPVLVRRDGGAPVVRLSPRFVEASRRYRIGFVALHGSPRKMASCNPEVVRVENGIMTGIGRGTATVVVRGSAGTEYGRVEVQGGSEPDSVYRVLERPIEFDMGSADLSPAAGRELDRKAELLGRHPGLRIVVRGHVDSSAVRTASSSTLASARANAAVRYLLLAGVSRLQMFLGTLPTMCQYFPGDPEAPQPRQATFGVILPLESAPQDNAPAPTVAYAVRVVGPDSVRIAGTARLRVESTPAWPAGAAPAVRWRSRTPGIASVDSAGLVRGRARGQAQIQAEIGDSTLVVRLAVVDSLPRPAPRPVDGAAAAARVAFQEGQRMVRAMNLEAAFTSFHEAARLDSANALYHAMVGATLLRLGRADEGFGDLVRATRLDSGTAWYQHELCVAGMVVSPRVNMADACRQGAQLDRRGAAVQAALYQVLTDTSGSLPPFYRQSPSIAMSRDSTGPQSSFWFIYRQDPFQNGLRDWRNAGGRWIERRPSGEETIFLVVGRDTAGLPGVVVRQKGSTPEVFIPGQRLVGGERWLLIRNAASSAWRKLGIMKVPATASR